MSTSSFFTRRRFLTTTGVGLASLSGLTLTGCDSANNTNTETSSSTDDIQNTDDKQVLKVYNWTQYISNQVLEDFTAETGIKVIYSTFDSNEAMYAKLKLMNNSGEYDLIFPSTDFVDKMRKDKMLEPLDLTQLHNLHHINPRFLNASFDPDNQYSIPYLWGSSGIAVNTDRIDKASITAWDDLWRPDYQGRVMLMNDLRDVFSMSLLTLGYSANTKDVDQIRQAYEKLRKLMPNVRTFNSDAPRMPFIEGETYLGLAWNGEVIIAQNQGMNELDFVYPIEGAIMWMDNICIPKNAQNIQNAHTFIDFLLRPENAAIISEEIGYASPNQTAKVLLPADIANNPIIYPPDELLLGAPFKEDVGPTTIAAYQKYWDRLKVDV